MSAFLDTNVLIRHLVGSPADQARKATSLLAGSDRLLLSDVIVAETVYVLESFYELERPVIANLMRAIVGFPSIAVLSAPVLLRALEVYEVNGIHFAEAYLVANAELTGVQTVASFDRAIDKVGSVRRLEPA